VDGIPYPDNIRSDFTISISVTADWTGLCLTWYIAPSDIKDITFLNDLCCHRAMWGGCFAKQQLGVISFNTKRGSVGKNNPWSTYTFKGTIGLVLKTSAFPCLETATVFGTMFQERILWMGINGNALEYFNPAPCALASESIDPFKTTLQFWTEYRWVKQLPRAVMDTGTTTFYERGRRTKPRIFRLQLRLSHSEQDDDRKQTWNRVTPASNLDYKCEWQDTLPARDCFLANTIQQELC